MFDESTTINNKAELDSLIETLRLYDPDFDPFIDGRPFPLIAEWIKTESNGYPHIVYNFRPTPSEKVKKAIAILENSDIVWSRYGTDTIEKLAERITNALQD